MRPRGSSQAVSLERVGAVASGRRVRPAAHLDARPAASARCCRCRRTPRWCTAATTPSGAAAARRGARPTSTAMVLGYYGISPTPTGITAGHADAVVDHTAQDGLRPRLPRHRQLGLQHRVRRDARRRATPTSPGCATCARPRTTSPPGCRSSSPSRSGATSWSAPRSPRATATCSSSWASRPTATWSSTTRPAPRNAEVRRVYDRAQFERIWIAASGGTAYVIRNG